MKIQFDNKCAINKYPNQMYRKCEKTYFSLVTIFQRLERSVWISHRTSLASCVVRTWSAACVKWTSKLHVKFTRKCRRNFVGMCYFRRSLQGSRICSPSSLQCKINGSEKYQIFHLFIQFQWGNIWL